MTPSNIRYEKYRYIIILNFNFIFTSRTCLYVHKEKLTSVSENINQSQIAFIANGQYNPISANLTRIRRFTSLLVRNLVAVNAASSRPKTQPPCTQKRIVYDALTRGEAHK